MKKNVLVGIIAYLLSICGIKAQDSAQWQTDFLMISDYVINTSGGIKTGNQLLGHASLGVNYQSGTQGFWKNGEWNMTIQKTSGASPSGTLIGDIQVASNIEGTSSKVLYECWVKQNVGQFALTAGLHDMNSEFFASNYGGALINSSFGIGLSFSLNMPVSIYPVTTLGGILSWDNGNFSISEGFYNMSYEFSEEETFHWSNNNFSKGFLSVTESRFRWKNGDRMIGEYKLGGFYKKCNHDKDEYIDMGCNSSENYGAYLIVDQSMYTTDNKEIGFFLQAGINPYKINACSSYYGGGIIAKGFFTKSDEDVLGFGIAHAAISKLDNNYDYVAPEEYETAIEISFEMPIYKRFSVQPDVQYIINPGASGLLSNALVAILRTKFNLN